MARTRSQSPPAHSHAPAGLVALCDGTGWQQSGHCGAALSDCLQIHMTLSGLGYNIPCCSSDFANSSWCRQARCLCSGGQLQAPNSDLTGMHAAQHSECGRSAGATDIDFRACTEMASSASVSRFVAEPLAFVLFRGDRVVVGSSGATAFRSWNDLLRSADLHQQDCTSALSTTSRLGPTQMLGSILGRAG